MLVSATIYIYIHFVYYKIMHIIKNRVIWLFTVLTDMLVLPPGEREMTIPGNMATVIVNQTDSLILPLMEFSARDPVFYNAMRTDVSIDFQNHGIYVYQ